MSRCKYEIEMQAFNFLQKPVAICPVELILPYVRGTWDRYLLCVKIQFSYLQLTFGAILRPRSQQSHGMNEEAEFRKGKITQPRSCDQEETEMKVEHKAWILPIEWPRSSTLARGLSHQIDVGLIHSAWGLGSQGRQVNSDPRSFLCLFLGVDCKIKSQTVKSDCIQIQSLSLSSLQPLANCLVAQSLSFPPW